MASIRRWRMTDARLGARCARLAAMNLAQARAQLGVCHRVLGGKLGQLLQELLVLLGPVDRTGDTVGALPPQVSHAALEHMTAGTSARMA